MRGRDVLQLVFYAAALAALAPPLGAWMARVYEGRLGVLGRVALYRAAGVDPERGMGWRGYALALLSFNAAGLVAVYAIERLQGWLPLDPRGFGGVPPALAFDTAASFASNANWQSYAGETTMSHATQMLGLTVQNFLSAATGMAVLAALARAFRARGVRTLGNFWVDLVRSVFYVLLPLSLVLALLLVSQGVVQTLRGTAVVPLVERTTDAAGQTVTTQTIALGPVASQVAIKQLGSNGGGFFGVNSAHPLENPTPLSNFLELLAILLLPAALCFTFGRLVGDRRQGRALLAAMLLMFLPLAALAIRAEVAGNPRVAALGVDVRAGVDRPGGNMEGKEVRFGVVPSALWAAATTAASNGSVDSMHDSYMPLGGLAELFLMQLGEVVFGGVGSGLYGLVIFAVVASFVAGLMVGRTPEYLGKKIDAYEMKMASLFVLIPPLVVLGLTAVAVVTDAGLSARLAHGPHGFSEILYAFTSMGNDNGSAFAGLASDTPFYDLSGGLAMLAGRFWLIVPTLALAGSLARKERVPAGPGTLPTHAPLFVVLLVVVVVVVGALTFVPALVLGPVVEHLELVHAAVVAP
jgi:potassium-transporting ATPase potassium-binding subunit